MENILNKAIDRLYDRGWCKGKRHTYDTDKGGACCLLGAFEAVDNKFGVEVESAENYMDVLQEVAKTIQDNQQFFDRLKWGDTFNRGTPATDNLDDYTSVIACFNNHPDTTFNDVVAVLIKTKENTRGRCSGF